MATVQSGVDSNLNRDAMDRVLVNPSGRDGAGSGVTPLRNSGNQIAGYLANDPSARYLVAGAGVYPTGGRNTLPTNPINNFDLTFAKRFSITGSKAVELRASLWNAFNHPQFIPGLLGSVYQQPRNTTRINLIPGNPEFNRHDLVYESNAREIQLGLRITFWTPHLPSEPAPFPGRAGSVLTIALIPIGIGDRAILGHGYRRNGQPDGS
ncbi:MAG: hypothetical protein FJW37_09470 [Acidobacteria bacterium]|nr:hypothetical protein [Acidobacteriota bacterium]